MYMQILELRLGFSNTTRNPEGILSHNNMVRIATAISPPTEEQHVNVPLGLRKRWRQGQVAGEPKGHIRCLNAMLPQGLHVGPGSEGHRRACKGSTASTDNLPTVTTWQAHGRPREGPPKVLEEKGAA